MINTKQFNTFGTLHIGGRESQQDTILIERDNRRLVMVIADGMGGHRGGEIASQIVEEQTKKSFQESINSGLSANIFLKNLIPLINRLILEKREKLQITPYTTIVIAIIQDGYIHYANIGDSRLYIFDKNRLINRTRDHSVPEMLFQMGDIEEEEMATHPDQNKLTKSLGEKNLSSWSIKKYRLDPSIEYAIVLCSDGLWEYFNDKEMRDRLFKIGTTQNEIYATVHEMINQAHKTGGRRGDNISLIVAKNDPIVYKPKTKRAVEPSFFHYIASKIGLKV